MNDRKVVAALPAITDSHLMTYLESQGVPFKAQILEIECPGKVTVGFIVPDDARTMKLITQYESNCLTPVMDYVAAEKRIKDVIMPLVRSAKMGRCVPVRNL